LKEHWWKEAVVYQIYPRSFNDSNGDGIGDLQGIINKLDYLKKLGIDVIWLSPVYQSPNDDNGYDISDYYDIMDEFGSMEDMEKLLVEAHQRDIKIIMDLVVNHTSDEHEWFEKSIKKIEPYQDYYIWKDGKKGAPPNNWGAMFGGSVWEYNEERNQYYLHLFSVKQPDLNWENPAVRETVYEMMKWWLNKGIDGFRMDVINYISKDQSYPDGKKEKGEKYGNGAPYFINGPRVHEFLQEMNEIVLSKYDIMTVGETPGVTPAEGLKYVDEARNELNMVFHFDIMDTVDVVSDKWEKDRLDLFKMKDIINKWYETFKKQGWNSIYLNNHDRPRMVSRFGDDEKYRRESAKMLITFNMTLPGTPYIYQGEEIGMCNVQFESIDDYRDIETLNRYQKEIEKGREQKEIMEEIYWASRDNARTPVQWDDSENAGFSNGEPWIKVNPNYKKINAASQQEDPASVLKYYQDIIKLRKKKDNKALIYGNYQPVLEDDKQVFSYLRKYNGEKIFVILNFFGYNWEHNLEEGIIDYNHLELIISNYEVQINKKDTNFSLRPYEARVYRVK